MVHVQVLNSSEVVGGERRRMRRIGGRPYSRHSIVGFVVCCRPLQRLDIACRTKSSLFFVSTVRYRINSNKSTSAYVR